MKRKQPSRRDMLSSCGAIGPDDGVDPRLYFRKASKGKTDRKLSQLCSEVARTLGHVLTWQMGDELLSRLRVDTVVPAPNSSRLLIAVSLAASPDTVQTEQVLEQLRRATGRLRAEVAAAVRRRRVPELAFHVELREDEDQ